MGWRSGLVGAVSAVTVAAGCATSGSTLESAPGVLVWSVRAPLRQPVWSYRTHALVAITDDHRLAEVSGGARPDDATTRLSAPLAVGRNLQISQKDDGVVFVPQPDRGKVASVDLGSLRQVNDFDAGPHPAYLAEDGGMRILLALSADGTAVTPVDQYGFRKLPTAPVTDDPADSIDGANRGRKIDYHLYGASGIRYYEGFSSPPRQRGALGLDVAVSAGDGAADARNYVAGHDSNTLYAVDSRRGGRGMELLASAQLPSPIRELGTDDTRIYAATDREVVVLETDSFTGFPDRKIPVIRVIDYRSHLPAGAARSAGLSGMAIGPHRVYLTLADNPYVVSVAKPHL
ncbi:MULTISPECIES: hypothetical protein [unclassified Mycobacterium]|uniref:hypothetical protein n=1 Tax=unclassified Mycobacterium TaxID=2642494 RepID=UPI000801BD05|nr:MULTISPECIES: hypothetical protein [unclassified Mycobacterium]OBH00374.1 hypothetical protein A5696_16690 [Mycobacterium sp. E2699]OBI51187.1 hypothetical protein A5705_09230 [Mycobacterium sp. E787]